MSKISALAITSGSPTYDWKGKLYGFGPYAEEINLIATLFNKVYLAAPTINQEPPSMAKAFDGNITGAALPNVGGSSIAAKVSQLILLPLILARLASIMWRADALHARGPSNIGLYSALLGRLCCRFRHAKYAGQWNGFSHEPLSNRLQRRLFSSWWWGAPITVYGHWPNQPNHVIGFFTSMMTEAQVDYAQKSLAHRIERGEFNTTTRQPLRILFCGRLETVKRMNALIEACAILQQKSIPFKLRVVGEGSQRVHWEQQCAHHDLPTAFLGGLPHEACLKQYEWADTLVLPSVHSEGWPKVVAEAMAYGVIPIAVNHGQVGKMLSHGGISLDNGSSQSIAHALLSLYENQAHYMEFRKTASQWSSQFSKEKLLSENKRIMEQFWQVSL